MPGTVRVLRPSTRKQRSDISKTTHGIHDLNRGNRIINLNKLMEMFNSTLLLHSKSQDCEVPQFDIEDEKKWGLGWKYSLRCKKCGYVSPTYKLYTEVETRKQGPNPAAANYTLQSTLMDMPLGNRRTQLLMAGMDKYRILLDRRQQTLIQKYETESPGN